MYINKYVFGDKSFNRYIVECKYIIGWNWLADTGVLIDT